MAKKAKKKVHRMPPLSFADRCIYWAAVLIIFAIDGFLVLFPFWNWHRIAFREEAVVAAHMTAGVLWMGIPWFVFMITTFILWYLPYEKRIPIFGKRNFKYGPPAWPKIYPLFMKNKPYVWVSPRAKQERRKKAIALVIFVVISCLPYPLSWNGRVCLEQDGSLCKYNALNIKTRDYPSGEIESVELRTYRNRQHRSSRRVANVEMILTTEDGNRYEFECDEFSGSYSITRNDWLPAMVELKRRYRPEIITCTDQQLLERVIFDHAMDHRETQMLYELFSD